MVGGSLAPNWAKMPVTQHQASATALRVAGVLRCSCLRREYLVIAECEPDRLVLNTQPGHALCSLVQQPTKLSE